MPIKMLTPSKTPLKEAFRLLRIFREFAHALWVFRHAKNCVTVYGSARLGENSPYYDKAYKLGYALAKNNRAVMTGGGPGLMAAANQGASETKKGLSLGCAIDLPMEQAPNDYLDRWVKCRYFFTRKIMLTKYSIAFVALPGGFGTLDELFEVITLVQTQKIKNFPIVLIGKDFWQPLLHYLSDILIPYTTIDPDDVHKHLLLTDSVEEAVAHIETAIATNNHENTQ